MDVRCEHCKTLFRAQDGTVFTHRFGFEGNNHISTSYLCPRCSYTLRDWLYHGQENLEDQKC